VGRTHGHRIVSKRAWRVVFTQCPRPPNCAWILSAAAAAGLPALLGYLGTGGFLRVMPPAAERQGCGVRASAAAAVTKAEDGTRRA
jgi:hypothetical protein